MGTNIEVPWWTLMEGNIIGFEESDDPGADPDEEDPEEEEEDPDEEEEEEEDEDSENEKLLKALRTERKERKRLEREAKARERKETASKTKDTSEAAAARKEADEEKEKTRKLGERLLDQALEGPIERAARKANFIDPEDAVTLINRDDLEFDQDPDDPSEIEVDVKSIETAVKKLAKKKPHLVKSKEDDGDNEDQPRSNATGSTFAGRSRTKQQASEDELRDRYPALRLG